MKQLAQTALIAGTCVLSFLASAPAAQADDMKLILDLSTVTDGQPRQRVALYANDIDPNSSSVDDRYRLTVDGLTRKVPDALLRQLDRDRRAFSYDAQSGGITTSQPAAACLLGGPAVGDVLRVRYLTWQDDKIENAEMAPVMSHAENCLFTHQVRPQDPEAQLQAMHTLAVLQTLAALYGL